MAKADGRLAIHSNGPERKVQETLVREAGWTRPVSPSLHLFHARFPCEDDDKDDNVEGVERRRQRRRPEVIALLTSCGQQSRPS